LTEQKARRKKANKIYNLFLNETSVRQVNLPSDVKEKFLAKYNNNNELGSDLFVECKDSAMRLLAMDSLPRFF